MLAYCMALIPVSLTPVLLRQAGPAYALGAAFLGLSFAWAAIGFIREKSIAQARRVRAGSHFITDGFDLSLIPSGPSGGRVYAYHPAGEVLVRAGGHPVVAARSYGKGRVVGLAWVSEGFVPEPVDPIETRTPWDYWEYEHALLARAVIWAAGREGDLRIRSLNVSGGTSTCTSARSWPPCSVSTI